MELSLTHFNVLTPFGIFNTVSSTATLKFFANSMARNCKAIRLKNRIVSVTQKKYSAFIKIKLKMILCYVT